MGLLSNLFHTKHAARDQNEPVVVGSPNGSLRYVPSFNDFLGDTALASEADAATLADSGDLIKAQPAPTDVSREVDVWRSVFNPGSNPNMHRVGKQVFDNVHDKSSAPTTWDYILRAEQRAEQRTQSFGDLDVGRGDLKAVPDVDHTRRVPSVRSSTHKNDDHAKSQQNSATFASDAPAPADIQSA